MLALGRGHLGQLIGQVLERPDPLGLTHPQGLMRSISHGGVSLLAGSHKGPVGTETQVYPLPHVNNSIGPSHFPSLKGSRYNVKGWGPLLSTFCQMKCF